MVVTVGVVLEGMTVTAAVAEVLMKVWVLEEVKAAVRVSEPAARTPAGTVIVA